MYVVSPERTNLVTFSPPIETNNLFSIMSVDQPINKNIFEMFNTFSGVIWLCILLSFLLYSIVNYKRFINETTRCTLQTSAFLHLGPLFSQSNNILSFSL